MHRDITVSCLCFCFFDPFGPAFHGLMDMDFISLKVDIRPVEGYGFPGRSPAYSIIKTHRPDLWVDAKDKMAARSVSVIARWLFFCVAGVSNLPPGQR